MLQGTYSHSTTSIASQGKGSNPIAHSKSLLLGGRSEKR